MCVLGDAVAVERLHLAARAVQREHQLRPRRFTQRMLSHERLQLAHQRTVPAQRELGIDPKLDHAEP